MLRNPNKHPRLSCNESLFSRIVGGELSYFVMERGVARVSAAPDLCFPTSENYIYLFSRIRRVFNEGSQAYLPISWPTRHLGDVGNAADLPGHTTRYLSNTFLGMPCAYEVAVRCYIRESRRVWR